MVTMVITGNPGTGKHLIGKAIARKLKAHIIDINEFVISNNIGIINDEKKTFDVDIRKAIYLLRKEILVQQNVIIIGHLAPYVLRARDAKFVVVLRRSPSLLLQTFKDRGYSEVKIKENIITEIIGVCLYDAIRKFSRSKVAEFDTSNILVGQIVMYILKALNDNTKREVGKIDWLSKIENEHNIMKLVSY
jgi:adenylate kinase